MLSPDYFEYRWSWYRPILMQKESAAKRCRVDARRLPLCVPGEDAREYVPYAIDPNLTNIFSTSVKLLHEYSVRYMIDGVKVSAHQLPAMNPVSRAMFKHLQGLYPHLSMSMLHHWCGDTRGGLALLEIINGMWEQSWEQDQLDSAPWVPAVNVFILMVLRKHIGQLSNKYPVHNDRIMVSVLGGVYDWALRAFLKKHIDGAVEMTRIATYETMIIPATPMAFLYQQYDANLLAEAPSVIAAYGLEPDLVLRMRVLREKVGPSNEAGIIALLAQNRMGEHMLKRSWARLSLWALAQQSKQGVWMQWVYDAKKLDVLISRPEKLPPAIIKLLESAKSEHPVAAWLLAAFLNADPKNKKKIEVGVPWLQGDVLLNAFRVFEEDVEVEKERRNQESLWLNKTDVLCKEQRGVEADKIIQKAYDEGELVYFQVDTGKSLHSGSAIASKQGCLRIDWTDYLTGMGLLVKDRVTFLNKYFLPGVIGLVEKQDNAFMDQVSASGCSLRGGIQELVKLGLVLHRQMDEWYRNVSEDREGTNLPSIPMCLALLGNWDFVKYKNKQLGDLTLSFSMSVSQAEAGVTHDVSVGRLMHHITQKLRKKPLGKIQVDKLESGSGHQENVLFNAGFALTSQAMHEFATSMNNKAVVKEFNPSFEDAQSVLSEYRILENGLKILCVRPRGDKEQTYIFVRVGRPSLAGVDTDIFELLQAESDAAKRIYKDGLPRWK